MSKFKFSFKQRVIKPESEVQGVVTALGEDFERGRYYGIEWVSNTGRPCAGTFWESEMLQANPPAAVAPGTKPKAHGKRSGKPKSRSQKKPARKRSRK